MKKLINIAAVLAAVLLLASCSLFSDLADAFDAYDITATVETGGNEATLQGDVPGSVDAFVGSVVNITLDSNEMESFIRNLRYDYGVDNDIWVVATYDTAYLDYLGSYYPDVTTEFIGSRGIVNEGTVTTLVTPYEELQFAVRNDSPIGSTALTFELIREGYAAEYTKLITLTVNVSGLDNAIEMAADEMTRLYNPVSDEVMVNLSAPSNLEVRGFVPCSLERTGFEYDSLNLTSHDYQITIIPQNYAQYLTVSFDDETVVPSMEYTTSSSSRDITYYVLVDSDIMEAEEYANGEDVQLRVFITDLTDSNIYYTDVYYPIEDYSGSMCSFTAVYAATNGNMAAGALVGTKVYVDASMEAFSAEDGFSNVMIGIFDPSGKLVANGSTWINNVGDAANGTVSSGWDGATEPFTKSGKFSFIPEAAGTYTVTLYGYDNDGYNLTAASGTFEVRN